MQSNNLHARPGQLRRLLGGLALLALPVTPAAAQSPEKADTPRVLTRHFTSGGKRITVEQFEPGGKGKFPAVLLLYGVDGLHEGNATIFRLAARAVAGKGFVVLLVHYYERTGTDPRKDPGLLELFQDRLRNPGGRGKGQQALRVKFSAWEDTVKDAVAFARRHPKVNGDRVGLVGYSLGGFLAASVAADPGQRITAVVTLFGGIPPEAATALKKSGVFPPTLIIAGDKDRVVAVQESYNLRDLLKDRKLTHSATIYSVDHGFIKGGKLDPPSVADAQARISAFLREHLEERITRAPVEKK